MNRARCLSVLLALLVLAGGCTALPNVIPDPARTGCALPFVTGTWQLTHTVAISVAGTARGALVGVTRVDADTASIHCALMTVEGMVVFEAQDRGGLEVIRALPPFTDPAWARGLVDDVRMTFLAPEGRPEAGRTDEGALVCRFVQDNGAVVDVITAGDDGWVIRRYNRRHRLEKEITAQPGDPATPAVPGRLVLTDHGLPGYTLAMNLIDARPVTAAAQ